MIFKIVSVVFWFIRQFLMPNPFDVLGYGIVATIGKSEILLTPDLLNWIVGGILPLFTFLIVRMYYARGSCPAIGSILYMFFFCLHIFILHLLSLAYPSTILIVLIVLIYFLLHVLVHIMKDETCFNIMSL